MGVYRAFGDAPAPLDIFPFLDRQAAAEGNEVGAAVPGFIVCHHHMAVLLNLFKGYLAVNLVDNGHVLGLAALKQFVDTGKTLGDVLGAGHAAGVEGAHGKLGARLANGLGRDNAHSLAHLHRLAVCQRRAIALLAHAVSGPAV